MDLADVIQPVLIKTDRLLLKGFYSKNISYIYEHFSKEKVMSI